MANTVLKDRHGPDWPLGFIAVPTPGTPVSIMSLVDPGFVNDPTSPNPGTVGAAEFTVRFQQLIVLGMKPGATGMVNNTGNVYLVRRNAAGAGSGNRNDPGVIIEVIQPGQTFVLASSASANDVLGPYRYSIDADTAGEGALCTLLIF